jgi:glycine oxidase
LSAAIVALGGAIHRAEPTPDELSGACIYARGVADLVDIGAPQGRAFGAGVKGQALLLRHAAPEAPQVFAAGLHVVPHADGTVAVGSTSEREFDDPAGTDPDVIADLHARAVAASPALVDAPVIETWAGVRPRARSRAPVLGEHPTRAGAYMANGGFKIGFAVAPGVADLMADLVLDGRDRIPPAFRVETCL